MRNFLSLSRTAIFLLVLLLSAVGCSRKAGVVRADKVGTNGMSEDRLYVRFQETLDQLRAATNGIADLLLEEADTIEKQRKILSWQSGSLRHLDSLSGQTDLATAVLDLWARVIQLRKYVQTTDRVKELPMGKRQMIVDIIHGQEDQMTDLARDTFGEQHAAQLRQSIEEYVEEYPHEGPGITVAPPPFSITSAGQDALGSIAGITLLPFKAVAGVAKSPGSIRDISTSADQIGKIIENVPQETRLQAQILLLELLSTEHVTSTVLSLERFSRTSAQLAETAQNLPKEVGEETRQVLQEVENREEAISRILQETRATVEESNRLSMSLRDTAGAVEAAVREISDLAKPTSPTVSPSASNQTPFDINDYTRTAEAVASSARELRLLVGDLGSLLGQTGQIESLIAEARQQSVKAVAETSQQARSLIDLAAWRAAQLLVLLFSLALLYRFLARRRERHST
jgi:hypothetical protein